MTGRDFDRFRAEALAALAEAGEAAARQPAVEAALATLTGAVIDLLGDAQAHLVPGALKEGERQFRISGVFLVLPDAAGHILVAEHGFPPEQYRLRIPIDVGHPGQVYLDRRPLILANTDEHADFKQILKTARMGSALYAPMFDGEEMLGQMVVAAQARNTFSEPDLEVLRAFAALGSLAFMAKGGASLLE
jgi:putative methionine-R-sulfoxide reductase with GAF domain